MYYCKNCGEQYSTDEAIMCVKCGVPKGRGSNYCHNCGKPVEPEAAVCVNCGVANKPSSGNGNAKSRMAAGLLGIFLGAFGVHNFYLGYNQKAIIQLVVTIVGILLLCCYGIGVFVILGIWIWAIVEAVMIFTGKIDRDANGIPLTD